MLRSPGFDAGETAKVRGGPITWDLDGFSRKAATRHAARGALRLATDKYLRCAVSYLSGVEPILGCAERSAETRKCPRTRIESISADYRRLAAKQPCCGLRSLLRVQSTRVRGEPDWILGRSQKKRSDAKGRSSPGPLKGRSPANGFAAVSGVYSGCNPRQFAAGR